jgi:hypothetical protein
MAVIYSYPTKTNPAGSDLILISDSADSNKTKQVKVSSLPSSGGGSVSSVELSLSGIAAFAITGDNPITSSGTIILGTTGGSAGQFLDYQGNWSTPARISSVTSANTAITVADSTTAPVLTSVAYSGGNNIGHVPTGGSGTTYLKGDGTWGTPSGSGGSLAILNEGTDITAAATSINFVGSGVTATAATNAVTVTIPDAFVIEDVQYSVAVAKGDALYISGQAHGSGRPTVGIADATAQQSGNEKYPVVGLAMADYSSGEGKMIVTGILDDFNTNSITNPLIGQPVYVGNSGSTGDTLTGTKPTGTDVIQNVAIINKTGANGSLQVNAIGRTNDLPNLEQGNIWLGDANGVPSALTIGNNTAVLTSNGTTASWQAAASSPVTSYTNGVDNRVVTSTGANGINGELGLTYDGSALEVTGSITANFGGAPGTGVIRGTFKSQDNTAGATTTLTFPDKNSANRTFVFKNGLCTSAT